MADETALRRDADRAKRAEALLNDELLTEAFAKLREQYREAWENTGPGDDKSREKLYLAMRTLPAVRRNLETMLMDGMVAAKQLANMADDQARAKRK